MRVRARRRGSNRFGIGRGLDGIGWWAFGVLAVGIASVAVALASGAIGAWRVARRVRTEYVAAACVVLDSRVATEARTHRHAVTGRRSEHVTTVYKPEVRYRYQVAGQYFASNRFSPRPVGEEAPEPVRAIVERYPAGRACTCWYDPSRPEDAFLEK